MSLEGVKLQSVDIYDLAYIVDVKDPVTGSVSKQTVFNAQATKTGITEKTSAIEIYGGQGNQKLSVLRSKKDVKITASYAEFSLPILASKFGVPLDKVSRGTYALNEVQHISSNNITLPSTAKEVLMVLNPHENPLTVVSSVPSNADEVQVTTTTSATTGTAQVVTLVVPTFTSPTAGTISVSFDDGSGAVVKTVSITTSDTSTSVANKIASAYSLTGWTVTSPSSSSNVLFTALTNENDKTVVASITDGTPSTGVGNATGSTTTHGALDIAKGTISLVFHNLYAYSTALVSYTLDTPNGKDNFTIKLNAKSFPKSGRLVMKSVLYDQVRLVA